MTLSELTNYAKLTNSKFEINYPATHANYGVLDNGVVNYANVETDYTMKIGIELQPAIWFWFEVYYDFDNLNDCENSITSFRQRYNCNNGHVIKGWKTGFNAESKMMNVLRA